MELLVAQLPGRGSRLRERSIPRLDQLVEAIRGALQPSPVPFALFGHSMGGLVAFELCRLLRARGLPMPEHLIISGRRAPELPDSLPPEADLTDEYLLARIRRYGGTAEEIFAHPELVELLLPVFRADFALLAAYRYVPGEPLDVPLTVLGGDTDTFAEPSQLAPWRAHTRGAFEHRSFPGDHFFIHSHEAPVLSAIGDALAKTPAKTPR